MSAVASFLSPYQPSPVVSNDTAVITAPTSLLKGKTMKSAQTADAVRVHRRERGPFARKFRPRLSREEKHLLLLRDELYGGRWDELEADLRNRMERKPYIFRLMNRIEDDLARIARLRAYEER